MIREKFVNNPYILKVGTVKYLRVPMNEVSQVLMN